MNTTLKIALTVLVLAVPAGAAVYLWYWGLKSPADDANANAVVTSLAESTRAMHHEHQTTVLGLPEPDDAA